MLIATGKPTIGLPSISDSIEIGADGLPGDVADLSPTTAAGLTADAVALVPDSSLHAPSENIAMAISKMLFGRNRFMRCTRYLVLSLDN